MKVLAIGCHPDDIEIACGGTLAKYVAGGNRVIMCHVANGNRGHKIIIPDDLRRIRIQEARDAGLIIGAEQVINIDVPDLEVDSRDKEIVHKIVDVIRRSDPDIIITHYPEDYMKDHVEVSKIVFDASFSASVPHLHTTYPAVDRIVPLYYMDTLAGINFHPQEYVDISAEIDIKLMALECHQSQIKWLLEHDKTDFLDSVKIVSKYRGLQCTKAFAEGFRRCDVWQRVPAQRFLP